MVYPSVAITPSTSFHVDAQLAADIDNPVEYFDSGQYQVSGTLSVEIEGTDTYQWTTPSFLTVPEPASALTGELAFAGVLALAWARRS
jgi:hypothetical protein